MTRSIVAEWELLGAWSPKGNAHSWLRNDDHRMMQPTGRVTYGYNCVQEIMSGTEDTCASGGVAE